MQEKFSVLFVLERVWKLIRKQVFNRGALPGSVAMRIDIAPGIRIMPALGHRHVLIQSLPPGLERQPRAAHKIRGAGDAAVRRAGDFFQKMKTFITPQQMVIQDHGRRLPGKLQRKLECPLTLF